MTRIAADWLHRAKTQAVCQMLEADGKQALFVGGCVRNALFDAPVSDIDISTDARPDHVIDLAEAAGLKAVPTGIDHGTITVVSDGEPHEVTTFRRDVSTDGRRAVVVFSDHIQDDASRRDFTMNALYARADGTVLDPLGGLDDLRRRHVRFIGDATARIREDYLRSLRYFRFHAWYGDAAAGMDADALAAIAGNLDGLSRLSRERVGSEFIKLLGAPDPAPSVAAMRSTGVLQALVPGADDRALAPLVHLGDGQSPDPILRLAALADADTVATLRLSKAQMQRLETIRTAAEGPDQPATLGYALGADAARQVILLRAALLEQPLNPADLAAATHAADQVFPVSAHDLMPAYTGKALGDRLTVLKARWIASGFQLTKDQLLAPDEG